MLVGWLGFMCWWLDWLLFVRWTCKKRKLPAARDFVYFEVGTLF